MKLTPQEPTQDMRDKMLSNDRALGIPDGFTERQFRQESQFDPNAVSKAGAQGYAQLMPATKASLESRLGRAIDPSNFDDSLAAQHYLMKENLNRYKGDLSKATMAYNAGTDSSKWNNPETRQYRDILVGDVEGETTGNPKVSKIEEQQARLAKLAPQMQGIINSTTEAVRIAPMDMSLEEGIADQSFQQAAKGTQEAGMWESAMDSVRYETLTSLLYEGITRPDSVPGYKISEQQIDSLATETPEVYADDSKRQYVLGAKSDDDFAERKQSMKDRADLHRRMANTSGVQKYSNMAAGFIGGFADPVGWAATAGLGSALMVAKNAVVGARAVQAVGMAGRVVNAAKYGAAGFAENAGTEVVLRATRNQDLDTGDLMKAGVYGALMGGTMGLAVRPKGIKADPMEVHAVRSAEEAKDRMLSEATQPKGQPVPHEGTVGHALEDVPATNPVGATAADADYATKKQLWASAFDRHQEVVGESASNVKAYYEWREKQKGLGAVDETLAATLDSVGLTMAKSKSKEVRYIASMLAEDPTGMNRQHANTAALDMERLKQTFRQPVIESIEEIMPRMLDAQSLHEYVGGQGNKALKQVGKDVAEYRLHIRNQTLRTESGGGAIPGAVKEHVFVTVDPKVQKMAKELDTFFEALQQTSAAAKAPSAANINPKGFMPYKWDIHAINGADPQKLEAFKSLLFFQYFDKRVGPDLDVIQKVDPSPLAGLDAVVRGSQKAEELMNSYVDMIRRTPEDKAARQMPHTLDVMEKILAEKKGQKVTDELAKDVRSEVGRGVDPANRTELDLLAKREYVTPTGEKATVRLLDFMDTDIGRMVDEASQEHAGQIALARRGLGTPEDIAAMKDVLVEKGASVEDMKNIDLILRSLTGDLRKGENAFVTALAQAAYASQAGKLGFNAAADLGNVVQLVGVRGMLKVVGTGFFTPKGIRENTEFWKAMKEYEPGLLTHDARLFRPTTESDVRPAGFMESGSLTQSFGQGATGLTSKLSGLRLVNRMTFNGLLPVLTNEIWKTIATGKGIDPKRMADLGLTPERVQAIRAQMAMHDPGRKSKDGINWDKWDQNVAQDFISAIQRGTGQAQQRTFVGETPKWMVEGAMSGVLTQFRRSGVLSAEKQSVRNAAIGDKNAATAFIMSTAWGALMYRVRVEVGAVGLSDEGREKYIEENFSGMRLVTGVTTMVNMSGLFTDVADAASVLYGGSNQGGNVIPALGAFASLKGAVGAVGGAVGDLAQGEDVDFQTTFRKGMRIIPGQNTIYGSILSNSLKDD